MTFRLPPKEDAALDRILRYLSDERHVYTGGHGARRIAAQNDVKILARSASGYDKLNDQWCEAVEIAGEALAKNRLLRSREEKFEHAARILAQRICTAAISLPANGEGHHLGDPDCICFNVLQSAMPLEENASAPVQGKNDQQGDEGSS